MSQTPGVPSTDESGAEPAAGLRDRAVSGDGELDGFSDLDAEMNVTRSVGLRIVLIVVGTVSVVLGVVGVVLPVLPTTPFLLLAAACYARSSKRFYVWLLTNRWFGAYIRDWRAGKGIPLRGKILAMITLVFGIGTSVVFFVPVVAVKVMLVGIGLGVGVYILRLPTRPGAG